MIGVLDSGVGGLSIYDEIKKRHPEASVIYLADKKNFPYGEKKENELTNTVRSAVEKLVERGAKIVVLACNSATVSTIGTIRNDFKIPIVGTEPAVKQASINTKNHRIGVLATERTTKKHNGEDLAPGSTLYKAHNAALVSKIENDFKNITEEDIREAMFTFLKSDVDSVVLGCTHYFFLKNRFQKMFPNIIFYSPTEAIVDRVESVIADKKIELTLGNDLFLCSGNINDFKKSLNTMLGIKNADIRKI
jgi:glutamate racemase